MDSSHKQLSENTCTLLFHNRLLGNCIPRMERKFIQTIQKFSKRSGIFFKGNCISVQQGQPRSSREGLGSATLASYLTLLVPQVQN